MEEPRRDCKQHINACDVCCHRGIPSLDLLLHPQEQRQSAQIELQDQVRGHLRKTEDKERIKLDSFGTSHFVNTHALYDCCSNVLVKMAGIPADDSVVLPLRGSHLQWHRATFPRKNASLLPTVQRGVRHVYNLDLDDICRLERQSWLRNHGPLNI